MRIHPRDSYQTITQQRKSKERLKQMNEQSREWYVKEIARMLNETDGGYMRTIYLMLKHHNKKREEMTKGVGNNEPATS